MEAHVSFKLFFLGALVALSLQAADPTIVVAKHKAAPGNPRTHYVYLTVSGATPDSLHVPSGFNPPPARVTVLRIGAGAQQDSNCVNVEATFANPPGNYAAAVLLPEQAVQCLKEAWNEPAAYLAPTLLLPPMEYRGKSVGPVSLAIPNDLQIEEDEDASVIDASKLVFKVIYRPWEGERKPLAGPIPRSDGLVRRRRGGSWTLPGAFDRLPNGSQMRQERQPHTMPARS